MKNAAMKTVKMLFIFRGELMNKIKSAIRNYLKRRARWELVSKTKDYQGTVNTMIASGLPISGHTVYRTVKVLVWRWWRWEIVYQYKTDWTIEFDEAPEFGEHASIKYEYDPCPE